MRVLIAVLAALLLASLVLGAAWSQMPGAPRTGPAPPDTAPLSGAPSAVEQLASALDVGGVHIVLQSTTLQDVQARLGGRISRQGEAGVGVRSLCYYPPSSRSPHPVPVAVLRIQSSEVYQRDVIHGFRLERVASDPPPDADCVALRTRGDVRLGAALRLGEPRDEVVATFGPPVTETPGTLLFLRAGLTVIEDTLFSVQNRAFMKLEAGQVQSVEVWKSTSIAQ